MLDVTNDNHEYNNDHLNKSFQKEKFDFYEIDSTRTSQSFSVNITINLSDRSKDKNLIALNDSNREK